MEYSGFENDVSVLLLVPIYYGCLARMEFSDAEKKNVCRVTQKSPAYCWQPNDQSDGNLFFP